MSVATKRKAASDSPEKPSAALAAFVPRELRDLGDPQTAIPRLARDEQSVRIIEQAVQTIPTTHRLYRGDAREMPTLKTESVHLVLTSPPYWTLKEYRESAAQLGHIEDYDQFPSRARQSLEALFRRASSWRPFSLRGWRRLPVAKGERGPAHSGSAPCVDPGTLP